MILYYTQYIYLLTGQICIEFHKSFEARRDRNRILHEQKDKYTIFKTGRLIPMEA